MIYLVRIKPAEVQIFSGKKVMINELILLPGKVSGISKNRCPLCAGIAVRNQQESVSALRKNHCPEWPGISVRFGQEYAIYTVQIHDIGINHEDVGVDGTINLTIIN